MIDVLIHLHKVGWTIALRIKIICRGKNFKFKLQIRIDSKGKFNFIGEHPNMSHSKQT